MEKQQQMQINVDFANTTPVTDSQGNEVFAEGVVIRKVSKFITGTEEDGVIPIPVFYNVKTGEIVKETLPKELRNLFDEG